MAEGETTREVDAMTLKSEGRGQRLRDPRCKVIEFNDDPFDQVMWSLIQTEPMQRLRRIRQLGFSEMVYIGATHTRLGHSIGTFDTARQLVDVIKRDTGSDFNEYRAHCALAASLLHDCGHNAFSHAFEDVGKRLGLKYARHEIVSDEIIRNTEIGEILNRCDPKMADDVANMIAEKKPRDIYSSVFNGQHDADRLDYMQRDTLMTGTRHGQIDFDWLMANIGVDTVPVFLDDSQAINVKAFVLNEKAIYAAETFVHGLFQLYPTVYYHKTVRSAEKVFSHLFGRIVRLCTEGKGNLVGLSQFNPIMKFSENPDSLQNALLLDDSVIYGSLAELSESPDPLISKLATMLRLRKLPKSFDIRAAVTREIGYQCSQDEIDAAVLRSIKEINDWNDEQGSEANPIWIDRAQRSPYKGRRAGDSPFTQILIKRGGECVDLGEVSPFVASIPTFKLYRAYIPFPDERINDTRLTEIIKQSTREVRKL